MTEVNLEGRILCDLEFIKAELISIKEHMVDADTILSEEEKILVKESFEHEKEGKLLSLFDLNRYTPQLCCGWDKARSTLLLSVGALG